MDDKRLITWLIQMTTHIATLHGKQQSTNAGPMFDDDAIPFVDEQFASWMGWRGEEAQQETTAWPAAELKTERRERLDRHKGELMRENRSLLACLRSIQALIQQEISKG